MRQYLAWIEREYGHLEGAALSCRCTPICMQMKRAFPELLIFSGHVTTASGNIYEHTWLQTPDGCILDPTEGQFGEPIVEYDADIYDPTSE